MHEIIKSVYSCAMRTECPTISIKLEKGITKITVDSCTECGEFDKLNA